MGKPTYYSQEPRERSSQESHWVLANRKKLNSPPSVPLGDVKKGVVEKGEK